MKRIFVSLLFLSFSVCDNRDGGLHPRNNPFDWGGTNFQHGGVPEITYISIGETWHDYDHVTGTGSLLLRFRAEDPNLLDTLSMLVRINTDDGRRELIPESDSTCVIDLLSSGNAYPCSLSVTDKEDSTVQAGFMAITPALIPPMAPEPQGHFDNTTYIITWESVSGATKYNVYSASSRKGPYTEKSVLQQPLSGTYVTTAYQLDKSGPQYYIVSSVNQSGECRSRDTLEARFFSDSVPVPSIDSVSKGTYAEFVKISFRHTDRKVVEYEIFRSETRDSRYVSIGSVDAADQALSFRDSAKIAKVYHYKIAALDANGKSSYLSESDSGYIFSPIMNSPTLFIEPSATDIGLYWDSIPGAVGYRIYRSMKSCGEGHVLLKDVSLTEYLDPVTSTSTYYYYIAPIDESGHEGPPSNCGSGNLGLLPAPEGIQVTNGKVVSISWIPVPGAHRYVIYRSTVNCPPELNEKYGSTESASFSDTLKEQKLYYYAIAAVDKSERSGTMSGCYQASMKILNSPTGFTASDGSYIYTIALFWTPLANAVSYNIYRSENSCGGARKKIGNTSLPSFADSAPSTAPYFYVVAGVDQDGIQGSLSSCDEGRVRLLNAPGNFKVESGTNTKGIPMSWYLVPGATGYIIYKGTSGAVSSSFPLDTTSSLTYFDTVLSTATQYYWVAAYNRLGPGERSTVASGNIIAAPTLSVACYASAVVLSLKAAISYTVAYVYRGTSAANLTVIDSLGGMVYRDTPPDYKVYYYKMAVRTSTGDLVQSNLDSGYLNLTAPEGLTAKDTKTGVLLTWNSVPGVSGYVLYKSQTSMENIRYREVSDTFFFDSISTTTRYYYRVASKNSTQESPVSGYVIGGIIQTPAVPQSVTAYGTMDAIVLQWYVSPYSSTPEGFYIYRSTSESGTYGLIDSTKERFYYDSITDSSMYYYKLTAFNLNGTSGFSNVASAQRQPPTAPSGITVSRSLYVSSVHISWDAVYSSAGITGYNIYRYLQSGENWEKIATTTDTVYFDSTAVPNLRYYYRVSTIRNEVEGPPSSSYVGIRLGPPETVWVAPQVNGIYVYWHTNSATALMYYVYRSTLSAGDFTLLDSTSESSYIDMNPANGDNYYKISARNLETTELSQASPAGHIMYPDPPYELSASGGTDSAGIRLSWPDVYGATSYRIYRGMADTITEYRLIATIDTTGYFDPVPSDSFYYYKIKAANSGGESSLSPVTARGFRITSTKPLPPQDFKSIEEEYSGYIWLSWTMPSKTIAYRGINIYRSDTEAGTYTKIYSTEDELYEYFDTPPNSYPAVYWYKTSTYNNAGESELSAAVSGSRH